MDIKQTLRAYENLPDSKGSKLCVVFPHIKLLIMQKF